MNTRREFLVGCSSAIAEMAGARFGSMSFASPNGPQCDQILVVMFLRGGMDGLNMLAPVDDVDYINSREPSTRILEDGPQAGLSLKGAYPGHDFRLHHAADGLKELYDDGALSFIHASGLTNGTRSHFEAQDLVERGVADMKEVQLNTGWLGRLINHTQGHDGLTPVVSLSGSTPHSLLGFTDAVAIPNPADLAFSGTPEQRKALESIYGGHDFLSKAGGRALTVVDEVQSRLGVAQKGGRPAAYQPKTGVKYPNNRLADTFQSLARLIRMDVELQFATIDYGGWDTHQTQQYQFQRLVTELSSSLQAFWNDMSDYHGRLTFVAMSEFGRRVKANQSAGTDHGHGNVMMAMGAGVVGGKMHGTWPGLATDQLDQRADLAVTTDFRWVLAELAKTKYGLTDAEKLFPGLRNLQAVGVFGKSSA